MVYKKFDIVTVPFPFTDSSQTKRRPAIVLSSATFNSSSNHSILAMITSSLHEPWPFDIPISNLKEAGLAVPSIIRMKLFTIDNRLILKKIGGLSKHNQQELKLAMQHTIL